MEYTINKLAKISGVTTRALRYYDEIGLLSPTRQSGSGYRIYGEAEVDALQQILFYRELGVELQKIKLLLDANDFDRAKALEGHLDALLKKRTQLDKLIKNADKTLSVLKGNNIMTDKEKFEGFKQGLLDENEKKYGKEIRQKYGDKVIDASTANLKGMSKETYDEAERLALEINSALLEAIKTDDPTGEQAQKTCLLHEKWLRIYFPAYTKEYHKELGAMYAVDERFAAYYDKIAPGCAEFLSKAIAFYSK